MWRGSIKHRLYRCNLVITNKVLIEGSGGRGKITPSVELGNLFSNLAFFSSILENIAFLILLWIWIVIIVFRSSWKNMIAIQIRFDFQTRKTIVIRLIAVWETRVSQQHITGPPEAPRTITALYRIEGFKEMPIIGSPDFQETPNFRTTDVKFSSLASNWEKLPRLSERHAHRIIFFEYR